MKIRTNKLVMYILWQYHGRRALYNIHQDIEELVKSKVLKIVPEVNSLGIFFSLMICYED